MAQSEDANMIILGDLNFDYKLDDSLNKNPIYNLEDLFELKQLITEPTRVTDTSSSTIDVILTSMPESHSESGVRKVALSDHYIVYTILQFKKEKKKHKEVRFRDYKNFNAENFIHDLRTSSILHNVSLIQDVDDAWDIWKKEVLRISDKHAPIKIMRLKDRRNPWVTKDIVKLMYARDRLDDKAQVINK